MNRTNNPPDPSKGGTRGFPLWLRQRAIDRLHMMDGSYMLAAETANCSVRSIRRWEERIRPYRMAGGEQRESITGSDQLLLSICLFIYPEATADKLCAFLVANGGGVYSRGQISERCFEMEISRKRCSKEAYDAFSASSLQKLRWFISLPPPLGVSGVRSHQLIDIDETGFYLKSCAGGYGRGHTSCRVRCPSHYKRNEPKVNVILAIEPGNPNIERHLDGSVERPRRWIHVSQENCDQWLFGDFMDMILRDIETNPVEGGYDDSRCVLWDNLVLHKTPYVTTKIQDRLSDNHFYSVDRPPYRPKMAPIEYVFCELADELARRVRREWVIDDLRWNIYDICARIGRDGKFHNTFVHCGFPF